MKKISRRKLIAVIPPVLVVMLFAICANHHAMTQGEVWQQPTTISFNTRNIIGSTNLMAAVIFGKVGPVSRVVVMQPSGATEQKILKGEPLYPGEKCFILFDGIPEEGTIVSFPYPVEGDHCRPWIQQVFIHAWGAGSGIAGEVYVCNTHTDYNYSPPKRWGEKGPPIKPCCSIMPGGCKATERFVGDIDKNNWNGLRDQWGNPIPFAGQWKTNQGTLNIKVTGASAGGTFGPAGRLSGTITRRFLTGEWETREARGTFKFEVSPKGERFVGTWTNSKGSQGEWNGDLVYEAPIDKEREGKRSESGTIDLSGSQWHWFDPKTDATYSVSGESISISAPNGNDLWPAFNFDAPRLTKQVSGDFDLQVRVRGQWRDGYNGAGLAVHVGKISVIRFERGIKGTPTSADHIALFGFDNGRETGRAHILFSASDLFLKLERRGNKFTGYASERGANWTKVGTVEANFPVTVDAGLTLINQHNNNIFKATFSDFKLLKFTESVRRDTPEGNLSGQWFLRPQNRPSSSPTTSMRIQLNGRRLLVEGSGWTGEGEFDGQRGFYNWRFTDGKIGRTDIYLDDKGVLHGQVRGSGLDWDFMATRP
jgi:regulation of enolase protein 1 (concanavalin A-like superfamily)